MKREEKEIAIKLRNEGKTFNEILEVVKVGKGTLSVWLKNVPIFKSYKAEYERKVSFPCRMAADAMRNKWEKKRLEEDLNYNPPLNDPFFMLGLGIYMGEGSKFSPSLTSLSNSDPEIIKIFKKWIEKYFWEKNFYWRASVHIYDELNIEKDVKWWSEIIGLSISNFIKTQIGVSSSSKRKRNTLIHGTLKIDLRGKDCWKVIVKIKKSIKSVNHFDLPVA
jgi:hypothetical protein